MASYSIYDYTSSSVIFQVTGVHSGQQVRFFVRLDADPDSSIIDKTMSAYGTSMTETCYGLKGGTCYAANVQVDGVWLGKKTFTTPGSSSGGDVFTPFDWTYAGLNYAGVPVRGTTKRAGLGVYVTAAEWNELAGLVAKKTGKAVTTVFSGRTMSASVVNTMARALGVGTVDSGDPITAAFFNSLRTAYNAL